MQKVGENVWVETGYFGANLGIIKTSLGLFLVDTPMNPSDQDSFLKGIQKLGPIAWIIVTDHHLDHFIGASFLPGLLVSHREVRGKFLPTFGPMDRIVERVSWSDPTGAEKVRDFQVKEPSLTFEDRLSFYLDPVEIHLETFPGHTPHTIAVRVVPDDVLFTGDNVVCGAPPFFHETQCPRHWIQSLQRLKDLPFQTLVPGHGTMSDRSSLDIMIRIIDGIVEKVQEALKGGMPGEEIQEKTQYLSSFPSGGQNPAQKDFWRQLERKGIGRLIQALKTTSKTI
jgi:glyoxylase-like metal-dependent hydrolase (beta-lactamase superfamily II)